MMALEKGGIKLYCTCDLNSGTEADSAAYWGEYGAENHDSTELEQCLNFFY